MKRKSLPALVLALLASLFLSSQPFQFANAEGNNTNNAQSQFIPQPGVENNGSGDSHQDVKVCGTPGPGEATCVAERRDFFLNGVKLNTEAQGSTNVPNAARPRAVAGFNSVQLRTAYGITGTGSPSKLIALVDYSYYPTALTDLNKYRLQYGSTGNTGPMPACLSPVSGRLTLPTSGSVGCFAQLSQTGVALSSGTVNPGWNQEEALDIQMATAICPSCSIVLIAASSNSFSDLNLAIGAAINAGAIAISNSYGGSDFPQTGLAPATDYYQAAAAAGIAITASAGDSGYEVESPASFTNVIGVGGTSLYTNTVGGSYNRESAWNGSGSGCSLYNPAPTYQAVSGVGAPASCSGKKFVADVSAVADPNTGVAVLWTDSTGSLGQRNQCSKVTCAYVFGGTSVSSPIIASLFGANSYTPVPGTYAGSKIWANKALLHDVTAGSNCCATSTVSKITRNSNGTLTLSARSAILFGNIVKINGAVNSAFNVTGTVISNSANSLTIQPSVPVTGTTSVTNSTSVSQFLSVLNNAVIGWDGPTGLGSPNTALAFR